jgi:CheY-like chemotaxis protein
MGSKHQHTQIPILAWTAHGAADDIAESLKAGCNERLDKPISSSTLLDAILRHIN